MPKKFVNHDENFANSRIDGQSGSGLIEPSPITRSPEQALQAEIELLAEGFAKKEPKMLKLIIHDLHAAQNGLPEHAAEARKRLAKQAVPESWPVELLAALESRLPDARLSHGIEQGLSSQKTKGSDAFESLFKKGPDQRVQ